MVERPRELNIPGHIIPIILGQRLVGDCIKGVLIYFSSNSGTKLLCKFQSLGLAVPKN